MALRTLIEDSRLQSDSHLIALRRVETLEKELKASEKSRKKFQHMYQASHNAMMTTTSPLKTPPKRNRSITDVPLDNIAFSGEHACDFSEEPMTENTSQLKSPPAVVHQALTKLSSNQVAFSTPGLFIDTHMLVSL